MVPLQVDPKKRRKLLDDAGAKKKGSKFSKGGKGAKGEEDEKEETGWGEEVESFARIEKVAADHQVLPPYLTETTRCYPPPGPIFQVAGIS